MLTTAKDLRAAIRQPPTIRLVTLGADHPGYDSLLRHRSHPCALSVEKSRPPLEPILTCANSLLEPAQASHGHYASRINSIPAARPNECSAGQWLRSNRWRPPRGHPSASRYQSATAPRARLDTNPSLRKNDLLSSN